MVSKRARVGRNLGTKINDLDNRTQAADVRARTPDIDSEAVEFRMSQLEASVQQLDSANYRAQQEYSIWDAKFGTGSRTTDWNTTIYPGVYWSDDTATSNGPASGTDAMLGVVYQHPTYNRVVQILTGLSALGAGIKSEWRRFSSNSGGSWTAWEYTGVLMGSTTARNAAFGSLSTEQERGFLANKQISWYNTDFGWEESYYVHGSNPYLSLDLPGVIDSAAEGWYPTGPAGPYQRLKPTAAFATASTTPVRSWGGVRKVRGGDDWFTYTDANGRVQVKKGGRYLIRAWTTQQAGSGTANYHLRQMSAGVTEQHVDGLAYTLVGSLFTHAVVEAEMVMGDNREIDFFCHSGSLSVHQGSGTTIKGEFSVIYQGPPLTNA